MGFKYDTLNKDTRKDFEQSCLKTVMYKNNNIDESELEGISSVRSNCNNYNKQDSNNNDRFKELNIAMSKWFIFYVLFCVILIMHIIVMIVIIFMQDCSIRSGKFNCD